jgi:hypothetical protein
MRAIRTCLFAVALGAVAACGGGDSKPDAMVVIIPDAPPDAPPDAAEPTFDFSCMGNTQGAAAANVMLSGFAAEIVLNGATPDVQPAHSATVDFCKAASTTCLTTDKLNSKTTPTMGCPMTGCAFASDALPTAGAPLDIYIKLTKTGDRPTFIYPASPVVANVTNIPGVMFTSTIIPTLVAFGIIQQDDGKGNMLLAVTDCATMPITDSANVTVTLKQNGAVVAGTNTLDLSQADPALAGTYAIFNVPAGATAQAPALATEVSATYKTKALRAHTVNVFRDSTTGTQLRPGF